MAQRARALASETFAMARMIEALDTLYTELVAQRVRDSASHAARRRARSTAKGAE